MFSLRHVRNFSLFFAATLIAVLLAAGGLLYFARHTLIKKTVEAVMIRVTGFRTEIGELHHEFPARLTLENVTMYDPPGYEAELFARAPYLYIELDLEAIFQKRIFRIPVWKISIEELHIEKNKEGVINGKLLKVLKTIMQTPRGPEKNKGIQASEMAFLLDHLELKIRTLTYRDRTGVVPKYVQGLKLKPSVYHHTTSFSALIDRIEVEVLNQTGRKKIMKLSPFYLEKSIAGAAKTVTVPTRIVTESTERLSQGAGTLMKKTTEALVPEPVTEKLKEMKAATKEQFERLVNLKDEKAVPDSKKTGDGAKDPA